MDEKNLVGKQDL
jgi:hypothetical protein